MPLVAISAGDAVLRIWEPRTDRIRAAITCFAGDPSTTLAFTGDGHYRLMGDLNDQFVYVVQTDLGEQLTLTADEFSKKFGWKNDPSKVKLSAESNKQPAVTGEPPNPIDQPKPVEPTPPAESNP